MQDSRARQTRQIGAVNGAGVRLHVPRDAHIQPYPLNFRPILRRQIWGGSYLAPLYNVPDDQAIGEAWTLSCHPAALSVCQNGPLAGLTLAQITERYPLAYLGQPSPGQFPLLIKLIDAAENLSVQVHPADSLAWELEGQAGKTESWYILQSGPGEIIWGHCFRSPEDVWRAQREQNWSRWIQRRRVQAGDLVHIPAGQVHALLGGTRVIEIQQASDVTYRLYDWDRRGQDGLPRPLHLEKASQAINYQAATTGPSPASQLLQQRPGLIQRQLLACPFYSIQEACLQGELQLMADRPQIVIVCQGWGELHSPQGVDWLDQRANTWLLPALPDAYYSLRAEPDLHVLIVDWEVG